MSVCLSVRLYARYRLIQAQVWSDGDSVYSELLGGSVVRALDSGPRGREFDSRRLRFRVTKSTQPSIPPGYKVNRVPACMAGVKAGRAHLCRVAGNTV